MANYQSYKESITALVANLKTLFGNTTMTEAQAIAASSAKPNTIFYTSDTHNIVLGGTVYGRGTQLASVFRFCPSGSIPGVDPDFSNPNYIYIVPDNGGFSLWWVNPGGSWSSTPGFQFDVATDASDIIYDLTNTPDLGEGDVQTAIETLSDETLGRDEVVEVDMQYERRPNTFYGGVNQNAALGDGNAKSVVYWNQYACHFFRVEGGQVFRFKNIKGYKNRYRVAFYDAWNPQTGTNGNKTISANVLKTENCTANTGTFFNFTTTAPSDALMMVLVTAQNNRSGESPSVIYAPYTANSVIEIYRNETKKAINIADNTGRLIDDWDLMTINTSSLVVGGTMPFWATATATRGKRLDVKAGQVLLLDLVQSTYAPLIFTDSARVVTEIHQSPVKGAYVVPNDGYAYLMDTQMNTANYIYNEAHGGLAQLIDAVEAKHDEDVTTLQTNISTVNTNIRSIITNDVSPYIPYWANPLITTNENHRQLIREVYIPGASSTAVYTLRCGRNYTQMTLYLDADGTQIAEATKGVTNASGTDWYVNLVNALWQLKSGADVIAYVKLKSIDWFKTLFLDAPLSTTNKFTTGALRNAQVGDVTCSPYINFLLNSGSSGSSSSPWADKVIAMYGDSVSAGNDATKPYTVGSDWPVRIADYLGASRLYNRSMPSTSNKNTGNGGKICGVDSTGHQTFNGYLQSDYNITWTSYKSDPSQITVPSGTEAVIPSAGCFWERITKMFPASIKSTINAVFIFFHNDGSSNVDPAWVANSTVDAEWAASGSDYYGQYNGDYNINETTGALYSTIMKMQLWMPQALIILCTPWSGLQNTTAVTANRTAQSDNVRYAAINNSVPLIDVNAICAVNGRNGSLYMKDSSDSVHPNANGGKLLARAFCSEMLRIVPKF